MGRAGDVPHPAAGHAERAAYTEWVLRALTSSGLVPNRIFQVLLTVFGHVRVLAVSLEPEAVAEQETGLTHNEFVDTREFGLRHLLAGPAGLPMAER